MDINSLKKIAEDVLSDVSSCSSYEEIENFRIKFLGKKGLIREALNKISEFSIEEKKTLGKEINELKEKIEAFLKSKKDELDKRVRDERLNKEKIDVSAPGKYYKPLRPHPLSLVINDMIRIFTKLGFSVEEGPEIEDEYYNFDALNIPDFHPARDDQDSFYIKDKKLLRTQTSGVQIRVMEKKKPPIAIISPGRCYRKDDVDTTHSPIFHQIEGLVVDTQVSFSDLKGVLTLFAKEMFGEGTKVRFRPDFFPFTEPSAEVAFTCISCGGKGCPMCKGTGWIEVAGCGMVDPEVFKNVGIDYNKYKGYAFGMGIERIAMIKYRIPDIRLFYENDIRFLDQFYSF